MKILTTHAPPIRKVAVRYFVNARAKPSSFDLSLYKLELNITILWRIKNLPWLCKRVKNTQNKDHHLSVLARKHCNVPYRSRYPPIRTLLWMLLDNGISWCIYVPKTSLCWILHGWVNNCLSCSRLAEYLSCSFNDVSRHLLLTLRHLEMLSVFKRLMSVSVSTTLSSRRVALLTFLTLVAFSLSWRSSLIGPSKLWTNCGSSSLWRSCDSKISYSFWPNS